MIDLHTHSSVSDGTDSPAELVAEAARAGLDVVALTDHDTTIGWAQAEAAARAEGVSLVRGAELSTRHEGVSTHLLAYLFDPDHEELAGAMARVVDDRVPRLRTMVERMAADGFDIGWADVEAVMDEGTTAGRPHLADALVARGIVRDRSQAFDELLHSSSPYYVPHYTLSTRAAIGLVAAAGGVPVLAHPFARARGTCLTGDDVRALAADGLRGIEVDHPDHGEADRELAAGLADELGLIRTGSSDYHGEGKVNRLGECTSTPESLEAVEAAASGPVEVIRPA